MAEKQWLLIAKSGELYQLVTFPVIIGRGENCDIRLNDSTVSTTHAQINSIGKGIGIYDLASANGVTVNGKRTRSAVVSVRDKSVNLSIGSLEFELKYGDPKREAAERSSTSEVVPVLEDRCWFFESDGQQYGPMADGEMFAAVEDGRLKPTDWVWRSGTDLRVKGFEVDGLFSDESGGWGAAGQAWAMDSEGARITCPYCWHRFTREDILFIASHADLSGDPILGPDEAQRFLPSRFTPDGLAVDAGGLTCPDMACPRCHIRIPPPLLSFPPLFVSIVGAPGSGKSYFLASSIWRLRQTLAQVFSLRFSDVDAITNQWLNDYEEKLFFQVDDTALQAIVKTDETAPHVYRQVMLSGMPMHLPLPCMFSLQPDMELPPEGGEPKSRRTLILYDNAGEHFQAGHDTASAPGTQHLVQAEGIIFLFDPSEDPRLKRLASHGLDRSHHRVAARRQDVLLVEMAGRVRKHLGLSADVRYSKPLIVGVSKADLFGEALRLDADPWFRDEDVGQVVLDVSRIADISYQVRSILMQHAPEVVATAESFADHVVYIPNSALGHAPSKDGIRPCDVNPRWVEVPLLYILARLGYVPVSRLSGGGDVPEARDFHVAGRYIQCVVPGTTLHARIPLPYAGHCVTCASSGVRFRVPNVAPAGVRI